MTNLILLKDLQIGQRATIHSLQLIESKKIRLQELGLRPGNTISCVFTSPFHDPIAYQFNDTLLAIRKNDSKNILVEIW